MAETPAPTLIGAERIVVSCEFDRGVSEAQRRGLCEQLAKKAKRYTSLPVQLATPADLRVSTNLRAQANQLLLRVTGTTRDAAHGRKILELEVAPVRVARPTGPLASFKSSVSLVEVQGRWVVQGPVDAFAKLLRGTKGPHKPIVSDS